MAKNALWQDDYWLLLMQIYLQKPVGIKPLYARVMVNLSLELHIHPKVLQNKMAEIARLDTPRIERIWETYSKNPRLLARAVQLLRDMKGFGRADEFYSGVETNETFERDFKPLDGEEQLTPVVLILVLDLYFRLTPITMVAETPEVKELASLLKLTPGEVAEILDVFQHCDPYLGRRDVTFNRLLGPCHEVWKRFGNGDTNDLAAFAEQLKEYYR